MDARLAPPASASATGSVEASPWAPEMAAHTLAVSAGTAAGVDEHAPRARAAAVAVAARAAVVRLFTSGAFRQCVCCPSRYQRRRAAAGRGAHVTAREARPEAVGRDA